MSITTKALSNTFYLFLNWIILTVLGYGFWVVLGKLLIPQEVGAFSTILNLAILISGLCFLGLNSAVVKLLSEYQAKEALSKIKGTIRWTSKIVLGINILLALAIFVLSPQLAGFGYLDVIALRLLSAVLIAISMLYLTSNYLYSLQQMKRLLITDGLISSFKIIIAALLIILGFGYFGAVVGFITAVIIFSVLRFKWLPFGKGKIEKKRIWYYALPAFISDFGKVAINQGGIIIMSILAPMASVGIFTLAFMFTTPMRIVPYVISTAIFPITSQQWALKKKGFLNVMVAQILKYSLFFTIPMLLAFIVFSREMLLLLATHQYLGGVLIIPVLSTAYLLFGISAMLVGVLYFTGKPKTNRNICIFAGFLNVLFCIALIPAFDIMGAAIAFLIAAIGMFLTSFYSSYKHLRFPLAKKQFIKNILASVVFLAIILLPQQIDISLAGIVLATTFASVVYVISLLYLKFFDKIDLIVLRKMKAKSPAQLKFFVVYAENVLKKFV